MKKLLILMLVLVMASSASAALSDITKVDLAGGILTIGGVAGASLYYALEESDSGGIQFSTDGAVLTGAGNTAGDLAAITQYAVGTYSGVVIIVGTTGLGEPPDPVEAGDWFTVTYGGEVGDTLYVYDSAVGGTPYIGSLLVTPEPMTIALLGLGGLFLRRRK